MSFVFADAPQRIYWELTRACDLACVHCRASAHPCTDPCELTTLEIFRILDEIAEGSTRRTSFSRAAIR